MTIAFLERKLCMHTINIFLYSLSLIAVSYHSRCQNMVSTISLNWSYHALSESCDLILMASSLLIFRNTWLKHDGVISNYFSESTSHLRCAHCSKLVVIGLMEVEILSLKICYMNISHKKLNSPLRSAILRKFTLPEMLFRNIQDKIHKIIEAVVRKCSTK